MKMNKKYKSKIFNQKLAKRQKDNYSSTEDSEVVLVFERKNAGLKKLSSCV
jgi:hypothetical protein